jgi:hypothetical protein
MFKLCALCVKNIMSHPEINQEEESLRQLQLAMKLQETAIWTSEERERSILRKHKKIHFFRGIPNLVY